MSGPGALAPNSVVGVLFELCAVAMLLSALASLGSKLFDRYVAYYGVQSTVLALATALVAYHRAQVDLWVLATLTLALKGMAIPAVTRRILLRRLALKRDAAIAIGLSTTLLAGTLLAGFAFLVVPSGLGAQAAVHAGHAATIVGAVMPVATAIVLIGGLCMVVRRHTVAQLFGWLIIENGVFLAAITLAPTFAFIVEAGVFLDLIAAVLIMVALVSGLAGRLASAAAGDLKELKG